MEKNTVSLTEYSNTVGLKVVATPPSHTIPPGVATGATENWSEEEEKKCK